MTFWAVGGALVGAVGGAMISSNAAKSSAGTIAQSAADSTAAQQVALDKQIALQEPWRQSGMAGLSKLNALLGLTPQQPGTPQMLTPGADGVFAPRAEIPQAQAPVTQQNFNAQAYLAANPDVAQFLQANPGSATPWEHYNQHGRDEGRMLAPPTPTAAPAPAPAPAPAAAPGTAPAANTLASVGSLNQPFGAADFAADAAPKVAPFTQTPNLPAFGQQAPGVPTFDQFAGRAPIGQFTDTTNLEGFQDVPAFNADAMRDDPGYQFRADQQQQALARAASAQGGVGSGKYLKDAMTYAGNLASQEYGNSFNRYQVNRGNLVQDYLTNRDTTQLQRGNQLSTYTTNRDTQNTNNQNSLLDYTTNLGTQSLNYNNQRGAYDTNFNQYQVGRTNAVNDWKDALNVYSLNRANSLQDYQSAYDRFQTNRSNVLNPLLSISGFGQQAANTTGAATQNFGNQSAAAIQAAGNARAAGQVGSANAYTGAIGQGINMYQQNQLLQRYPPYSPAVMPPNPDYYGGFYGGGSALSGFN